MSKVVYLVEKRQYIKTTQSVRLLPETLERLKKLAPEGNVSLLIRQIIDKALKNLKA
jgi:predicted DNA-binding protein